MRIAPVIREDGAVEPAPIPPMEGAPLGPMEGAPLTTFGDVVAGAVREAGAAERAAQAKADALAAGTLDDLHGTMIAAKEAEISVHLIGTIRNKLLDAFHELWRIGV